VLVLNFFLIKAVSISAPARKVRITPPKVAK